VRLELAALRIDRDAFQKALQEEQIGTGLHYPAVHLLAYYREKYGYGPGSLPAAEAVGESILSLPLFPRLEKRDQDDVVAALRRVIAAHRR
jgi:dTDP-4-amino-4,6-dideoxygalactose transaminase